MQVMGLSSPRARWDPRTPVHLPSKKVLCQASSSVTHLLLADGLWCYSTWKSPSISQL